MKRKQTDRTYLKRVVDRSFLSINVEDGSFSGSVSLFRMGRVTEPCIIKHKDRDVCVLNDGYSLLQYIPNEGNIALTVFLNENNELLQWYFDIIYSSGIGGDGIPIMTICISTS